jgi:hypothetical protein
MRRSALTAALLLLAACTAAPPRGWYRPAGAPPVEGPGAHVEQDAGTQVLARCQGVYQNQVDGRRTATVHVQLEVARTAGSDLVLPRAELAVDVRPAGGGPPQALALSEAFAGPQREPGDLRVPGWTRRPFDLFFDAPGLLDGGPPDSLLLRWELRADGAATPGQCEFARVPPDDPFSPERLPPADASFGYRSGWYLPGVRLGERRLRASGEQRLHHLFHEERGWPW